VFAVARSSNWLSGSRCHPDLPGLHRMSTDRHRLRGLVAKVAVFHVTIPTFSPWTPSRDRPRHQHRQDPLRGWDVAGVVSRRVRLTRRTFGRNAEGTSPPKPGFRPVESKPLADALGTHLLDPGERSERAPIVGEVDDGYPPLKPPPLNEPPCPRIPPNRPQNAQNGRETARLRDGAPARRHE